MYIKPTHESKKKLMILVLLGAAAGFINGLLGAGGGILLVWVFSLRNPNDSPEGVRDTFASTLAAILPITALSAILYSLGESGTPSISELAPLILPAIAGGAIGAFLLHRINTMFLKKIFALLILYSGISMVLR